MDDINWENLQQIELNPKRECPWARSPVEIQPRSDLGQ